MYQEVANTKWGHFSEKKLLEKLPESQNRIGLSQLDNFFVFNKKVLLLLPHAKQAIQESFSILWSQLFVSLKPRCSCFDTTPLLTVPWSPAAHGLGQVTGERSKA